MRGRSRIPDSPHERRSAVRAEHARNAEKNEETHRTSPRISQTRELGAPPRLRTSGDP